MLSGKSLNIEYSTFISQQSSAVGKSFAVQVVRAASRLQKAFITLFADPELARPFRKPSITFHHPMFNTTAYTTSYNVDREVSLFLQLGAKRYPEYECNNISECFYRLKQALNLPD